ncbi:MAG: SDR family oxidoreductase [Candidatus Koribacter versatilis]|uniref:SDR family oxidoreductase n=1 Tax=Candidatus Korobacter versatilis TaxID=658062 RepID=A0A932EQ66_9BACT|nr:SDR family oxidoreductase [Candidatus Koribacter versatilis]
MTKELENKVAVITGGTSGIGRDTAILFAQAGAKVIVAGRREKEGKETLDLVRAAGGEGIFVKTDVAKAADVAALFAQAVAKFGRVDIGFNNAGIEGMWAPVAEQTEADWDAVLDINLKGMWLCLKHEIRQMLKQAASPDGSRGAIVNMASVAGWIGAAGAGAYCASKHAVIGLTKAAALETATQGIRINAICPAVIETPMGERLFGAPEVRPFAVGMHPIGRFGKPMEVAEAVLWMCSDRASFMTGQSLVLDGGFLAGRGAVAAATAGK